MTVTLANIRAGLAANLAGVVLSDGTVPQCSGYVLENPTAPSFDIEPGETSFDEAFNRGLDIWTMTVRALVAHNADVAAQQKLDEMCAPSGAGSVKAAIESDRTLGGVAQTLKVTTRSGYRKIALYSRNEVFYLSAEWSVEIYASGS